MNKPCPFCGSQPVYTPRIEAPWHSSYWPESIGCAKCRIMFRTGENGVDNAVTKWNTQPLFTLTRLLPILRHPFQWWRYRCTRNRIFEKDSPGGTPRRQNERMKRE